MASSIEQLGQQVNCRVGRGEGCNCDYMYFWNESDTQTDIKDVCQNICQLLSTSSEHKTRNIVWSGSFLWYESKQFSSELPQTEPLVIGSRIVFLTAI